MPTTSVGYVNGRISVRRREQLTQPQLERLRSANSAQEAMRILVEMGWGSGDAAELDYEKLAAERLEDICAFVRQTSPDENAIDCFLLRYDIENLKMLLKARSLGIQPHGLSRCGVFPVDALQHAVNEGVYDRVLPQALAEPLGQLEKRMAVQVDAMDIDVTLDKALYALIFEKLEQVQSSTIRSYFSMQVDFLNALATLRFTRMGQASGALGQVLLPGGKVSTASLEKSAASLEGLPLLYTFYGRDIVHALEEAAGGGSLSAFEKTADDTLLALFTPYKFQSSRLETIIGYLLACQREVMAVRLVLAGKYNGFPEEAVSERLRELYG